MARHIYVQPYRARQCLEKERGEPPPVHEVRSQAQRTQRDREGPQGRRGLRSTESVKETNMANYSRWGDVKKKRREPTTEPMAS